MITVLRASPFATIQDHGRYGFRDSGVPVSGIADRDSGIWLNGLLGNEANAAMIEWAVAGGALRFEHNASFAIGGADVVCVMNDAQVQADMVYHANAGNELSIERFVSGRFLLIAIAGGIDVRLVLGSRSTLLHAGFGGLEGRRLRSGDLIPTGVPNPAGRSDAHLAPPDRTHRPIHVIRGPQADRFGDIAWTRLLGSEFSVSNASDRVGYRLEGVELLHNANVQMPSEPTCVGAIQVPSGGAPIVIMNDGPTVGGYPKIAVICKSDISRFAQLAPGDKLRFKLTD